MISIMKQEDETNYSLSEFIVDAPSDVSSLLIDVAPGSTCLVIDTSDVYIMGNNIIKEKIIWIIH